MQKLGQTLFLYWIEVLHLLRDTVQVLSEVKCICSLKIQLGWDLNIFPVLLHMTEDQWPHELGKTVSSNERGETEIEARKIEKKNDIDSSTNGSSTSKVIIYKDKAFKMYIGKSLFTCFVSLAHAFNPLSNKLCE